MSRWWQWLTRCLPHGHKWKGDPAPTWEQGVILAFRGYAYTPSSTCTRCGARSF